jgi:hypothetical protein
MDFCAVREAPYLNRSWANDRKYNIEIFSDTSLSVCNSLIGSFDLSLYMLELKNVHMGSVFVPMPSVVIVSSTGQVIHKYIAASPGTVLYRGCVRILEVMM